MTLYDQDMRDCDDGTMMAQLAAASNSPKRQGNNKGSRAAMKGRIGGLSQNRGNSANNDDLEVNNQTGTAGDYEATECGNIIDMSGEDGQIASDMRMGTMSD